jgi:tRNA A-37 threonylcarbamoyl transferase component Bud32
MRELPELFPPGHRLGKYQLIRRLAVGGMAEIYLARAQGIEGFEKVVVCKRILPQHALDPELRRMFLDEARLMATLTHPHITQVYDVGTDGDAPFFAMEYVHGANVREILKAAGKGDPLPLEHAIAIVAGAAAGLHYAHEKQDPQGRPLHIVHRDVSPSNVLVTYDGSIKVSDFGIAKWSAQRTQTQEGALKGKFAYMSPEQCRGEPLDRRSDVFALGTLLFELSTGSPPFSGASDYVLLNQIVRQPTPRPVLSAREGAYPGELEQIVMRALAKAPADRYATAQDLQLALEGFAREQRLVVSPVELGRYMQRLFADRIQAWTLAQQSGKSLGEHLAEVAGQVHAPGAARLTPATATDLFAQPGAPARKAAPGRRRRALLVSWLLLLVAAGGLTAFKLQSASRRATHRGSAEVPPARNAAPSAAAPAVRARSNQAPSSTEARGAHTVEDHPPPPAPSSRSRRPSRARPVAPAETAPALKVWDPDSPVPP